MTGVEMPELETATTLCGLFQASTRRYPDHVLVHHMGRDWTYREIQARATSLAGWLREHGLEDGQRVGLLVPNCPEYVVCYFGVLMAGGIVVSLNPDTTPRELAHTLAHCEPAAVITVPQCEEPLQLVADRLQSVRIVIRLADDPTRCLALGEHAGTFSEVIRHHPLDQPAGETDASRIAQIIYTSGTTGRPKGVTLSHGNLLANCRSIVQYLELESCDSVFVILPFSYSYGNSLLLTHVAVGGRLILASDFVFWNRALDLIEKQRATGFAGVPSTYAMLLHKSTFRKRAFPRLRYLTCAGGALAPAVLERVRQCVPHVQMFLMYGQTEAAARLSTLMPGEVDRKPGSIGKGIPGVELSVLNREGKPVEVGQIGEIVARGRNVMVGYWNDPESTSDVLRRGGLHTGDMARIDEDGYIYIVGRRSDLIKSGSYRINPREIEEVILEVENVAEVAVVGGPDEILGEVVVAFVVPSVLGNGPSEEAVIEHCKRALPRYKQVRRVRVVEALPKTSNNKVKRVELRRQCAARDSGVRVV